MTYTDQSAVLSDEAIVEAVRHGELAMYELLMRRYNQRLYRLARSLLHDSHEAEDVVQEAYVRAYERLAQLEDASRFAGWLMRIAVNEARARIGRRRRANTGVEMDRLPLPDSIRAAAAPEARASAAEVHALLERALESLPEPLRVVFVLREVEGMDVAETAECLGLSSANVKVRLHRSRQELRRSLERAFGHEIRSLYPFGGERCDRIVHRVMARLQQRR